MRRVVCKAIGDPSDLLIEDVPDLVAGPGQVVIDVKACGVNFVDALFVRGSYQIKPATPFTPGGEVAGVVQGTGQRVIASTGLGGYASQVIAGEGNLFPLPDAVSFELGASLVQSYATALFSLEERMHLQPDEWVLVLGAGGGVGRACIDVARDIGAKCIGVASSAEKRQAALDAGAVDVIDSAEDIKTRAREISGGGVDVVVDPVGGALAEPSLRALKWFGRYLVIGFAAGEIPRLPINQVLLNNRTIIGVDWGAWGMRNGSENKALIADALERVAAGRLKPGEPTIAKLEDAGRVLNDIESRKVTGKVVLIP